MCYAYTVAQISRYEVKSDDMKALCIMDYYQHFLSSASILSLFKNQELYLWTRNGSCNKCCERARLKERFRNGCAPCKQMRDDIT